jgi:hypothetical protein
MPSKTFLISGARGAASMVARLISNQLSMMDGVGCASMCRQKAILNHRIPSIYRVVATVGTVFLVRDRPFRAVLNC